MSRPFSCTLNNSFYRVPVTGCQRRSVLQSINPTQSTTLRIMVVCFQFAYFNLTKKYRRRGLVQMLPAALDDHRFRSSTWIMIRCVLKI